MANVTRRAVVVGVTGQVGTAVARRLLADGWAVTGLHRGGRPLPPDLAAVDVVRGSRDDDGSVARAVGSGADVLVDTVAYTSAHARQLLRHAADLGSVVVVSSAAVYADADGAAIGGPVPPRFPVPVREDQRLVAADDATYGGGKVLLERVLLDARTVPVTSLRAGAVHGAGSSHLREWWFVGRALDGRRAVPLAHRGASRFHPVATANLAELARLAAGWRSSQVLNAADPDCPSVREIGDLVAAALGHDWALLLLPDGRGRGRGVGIGVGVTPWSVPNPVVLDMSAAERLGYRAVTTYAQALPGLVAAAVEEVGERDWRGVFPDLAGYPRDHFDYAAEDALLRELADR